MHTYIYMEQLKIFVCMCVITSVNKGRIKCSNKEKRVRIQILIRRIHDNRETVFRIHDSITQELIDIKQQLHSVLVVMWY